MIKEALEILEILNNPVMASYYELFETEDSSEMISEMGVDIDNINKNVKYNPKHQKNVDTGNIANPRLFETKMKGEFQNEVDATIYSIFKRKQNSSSMYSDGDPLMKAFEKEKDKSGMVKWKISKKDRELLISFIGLYAKQLPSKIDTIILVPTRSLFVNNMLTYIAKEIKATKTIVDILKKLPKERILDYFIDYEQAAKDIPFDNGVRNTPERIKSLLSKRQHNSSTFSFGDVPVEYRKYIQKAYIPTDDVLKYADDINNKNVLVFDDTVSSGKSLTLTAAALREMFVPKSLTFMTIMSPLYDESGTKPVDSKLFYV